MRFSMIQLLGAAGTALVVACTTAPAQTRMADAASQQSIPPTGFGPDVDRDVARVRASTKAFQSLDKAVAAGYPRSVSSCLNHPQHGAMGFHHQNEALLDDRIEIERPEILVYERKPSGEYLLNGVEYIVPLSSWTRAEPPTVMGQRLKRAPSLGIWYLHVWIFAENPSGLFADWNPEVKCPAP